MEALEAHDLGMMYFFGSLHRPWLDPVVIHFTDLGEFPLLAVVVVAAMGWFLRIRRARFAGIIVLVSLFSYGMQWSTKLIVERPRPNVAWRLIELPQNPSFPSGHALCSMAIYGCIGLLLSREVAARRQEAVIAAGVCMAVLIGLTRIYLGVHYPLDVLGGWTAGLACAVLGAAMAGEHQSRTESPSIHTSTGDAS